MVLQILDSNISPRPSDSNHCQCLVCLETVPQTNVSSNTEQVGYIFSDLFKVLCDSMKWTPPNKYQLNFRTDPFPFCQKCRLIVVKLRKNHQLLKEIQDHIDRLAFELSAMILKSQNQNSARRLDQELDTPETAYERNELQGTASINILEKTKYYRNVIINRYSPSLSIKLTADALDPDTHNQSCKSGPGSIEETTNEDQRFESGASDVVDSPRNSGLDQNLEGQTNILDDVEHHDDQELDFVVQDVTKNSGSETLDDDSRSARKTRRSPLNDVEAVEEQINDFEDLQSETNEDSDYKPDVGSECEEPSDEDNVSGQELTSLAKSNKCIDDDPNEEEQLFVGVDQPFRTLRDRVKKVGDFQFILDDKFPYEFSNNRWKCVSCNIKFAQKGRLRNHLNFCPGRAPEPENVAKTFKYRKCIYDKLTSGQFRCRHCTHLCPSSIEIIRHMQKCHAGQLDSQSRCKPWYVEIEPDKYICNQNFPFEFLNENFKCGTCENSFAAISEILSHVQKEHSSLVPARREKITCESTAPGTFLLNGEFSFEKTGSGDEFRCNQCIYSCQRLKTMKDHIKCKHIDAQRFSCDTCWKTFGAKKLLEQHQTRHGKDRPFVCELCGKAFKLQGGLRSHQAVIHPEIAPKKFICETCGKCFGSMNLLRAHAKSHELVICDVCGKLVNNGHGLRIHLDTHREEAYACTKCGKKFLHYNSLYVHLKSHDGVKPYSCDICGMKFTQSYSVVRHKNVAHSSTKINAKSRKRKLEKRSVEDGDESD